MVLKEDLNQGTEGVSLRTDDGSEDPEATPHLRADAQRNLELILAAARTVFARRGFEATLDDVAREAGLGVGTVYRRFRDKSELAEAILEEEIALLTADAEEAAEIEDPWEGLVTFLNRVIDRQANNCGLRDLMNSSAFGCEQCAMKKDRLRPVVQRLVERARDAGELRDDFDSLDLPVLGVMLGAAVDFTGGARPDVWKRYLGLILDGMRAGDRVHAFTAAPLTEDELATAMQGWRPSHPSRSPQT